MSTSLLFLSRNLPCPCVYMGTWWCCGDFLSRICLMKSRLMQKCLSSFALPVPEIHGLKIKVLMMFFFPAKSVPTHHSQRVFNEVRNPEQFCRTHREWQRELRGKGIHCCLAQGKGSGLGLFPHTLNLQLLETKGECLPMLH